MAKIKFFNCQKKFNATSFQWFDKQKFVLQTLHKNVADIRVLGTHYFFIIHFLVSVADYGYVNFSCSYLSKSEAVKLSFTLFMFCYNII